MKEETKKFIDKKLDNKINYKLLKEDEINLFIKDKKISNKLQSLIDLGDRSFFVAYTKDKIVGYASLYDSEKSLFAPLKNVISLSTIDVEENYKNKGIATKLLEKVTDFVKKHNIILKRTEPTEEGENYIFKKFTKMLEKENVNYIPENICFIYEHLERNLFKDKKYKNSQQPRLERRGL